MSGARALRATAAALLVGAAAGWDHPAGSPSCPCVDPWVDAAPLNGSCRPLKINRERHHGVLELTDVCVPPDYGAGSCQAWDNATFNTPCMSEDGVLHDSGQPEWCTARWCYVDAATCERPMDPSDAAGTGAANAGLTYSYETCGNLNSHSSDRHYEYLRGRHLRVSYPGDSSSGYTLLTDANGVKQGSVVEFMRSIAQEAQFTWDIVPVGNDSKAFSPSSSFTACVYSVALNETDMCIGNFWVSVHTTSVHARR